MNRQEQQRQQVEEQRLRDEQAQRTEQDVPAHDSGIEQPVTSQGDGDSGSVSGIGETLSPADELPDTGTGDDQA